MRKLLLLFLASLVLRIGFAVFFHFDGLYGQDPFAYFDYTVQLRGALAAGSPPPPFFWPIGYPLLAVLASLVTGLRPLAGQLISILAGSLVAPLVYLIVLEVEPARQQGALLAALLIGTAGQMMLSSLSYMADAAGLAWVTLSALAMLRYTRLLRPRWLALSAFTLGFAVLTRWAFALTVFPWALAAFLAWHGAKMSWLQRLRLIGLAVLVGGFVLVPQFLPSIGQGGLAHVGDLQVVGWNPANAFKSTITNSDGTFHYERPIGLFYALPAIHPAFVFPLLTPFLVIGIWSLRKRPLSQIALLLGWPLIMYLFLAGIAWENPRFSLAYFPPLAILTGVGLQTFWNATPRLRITSYELRIRRFQLPITNYQLVLTSYLAVALLGSLAWAGRDLRNFTAANNAQIAAAHWVEAHVPPDASVITFGVTLTMQHRTSLETSEIYLLDPESLAELVDTRSSLYLFLDLGNINSQWEGLSPQLNYLWLQENTTLTEIDHYPPYTLFQVSAVP
ncbi:MAG: glycosyltransferase family 39 protein [Candidatus Promineifilaceae bacterium]